MDAAGWATWGVTAAIALAGLVLGIRAERRTSRYRPEWAFDIGIGTRVTNRTGEDAAAVKVQVTGDVRIVGRDSANLVAPGETFECRIVPAKEGTRAENFTVEISWYRRSTSKRYRQVAGSSRGQRVRK
jgi:hypothetical protein